MAGMPGADFHRIAELADSLNDCVYTVDRDRRITAWNSAAERVTGYTRQEVLGRRCHENILCHCDLDGMALCAGGCPLTTAIRDERSREDRIWLRHKLGYRMPVEVRTRPIRNAAGEIAGALEVFREPAATRREVMHTLRECGCLDEVTGVPDRAYGEMRLGHRIEQLRRFGLPVGWVGVRLTGIEEHQSRYGPAVLSAAMTLIARTLEHNLGSLDILCRWSINEFRIAVHGAGRISLKEFARLLVTLLGRSELEWWGDRICAPAQAAAVAACATDSIESIELRLREALDSPSV